MATVDSTRVQPVVPPSTPIRPAVIRGQLVFTLGDVAFTSFRLAACAWSAVECHRLDLVDLVGLRAEALKDMRRAAYDVVAFAAAAKREAELAANIRRLRREGMVLLAVRSIERIEELEHELRQLKTAVEGMPHE